MRYLLFISIWVLTFSIGSLLFWTSGQVQQLQSRHGQVLSAIQFERERTAVLRAEWHYLNNPIYLSQLIPHVLPAEKQNAQQSPKVLADSGMLPEVQAPLLPPEKPHMIAQTNQPAQKPVQAEPVRSPPKSSTPPSVQVSFATLVASLSQGGVRE